jgi:AraC-like DNA-binding protein
MTIVNILNTIILLGALQGFITSGLLLFLKKNKTANRFLGYLIFLMALASINLYGNYVDWFNVRILYFLTQVIPLVIVMPLGPLLYFYVQAFADPNFKGERKNRRHFYSIIIDFIPSIVVLIYFIGISTGLIVRNPKPWGTFVDHFNVYADIPRWLSLTIYIYLSSKYLSNKSTDPALIPKDNLKWLSLFLRVFMIFQVIWLCYLIPYVVPAFTDQMLTIFGWYPIYIPLAILIYWLGIKGYMVAHIEQLTQKKNTEIKNSLSLDEINNITASLKVAMEVDKIYLDPTTSLNTLAKHINYSPKIISAVLNQHLQKSFNEYVNEYRVAEFKEKFLGQDFEHLTITGIALECGFNSQATFQRAFKEFTGVSPSKFRKTTI